MKFMQKKGQSKKFKFFNNLECTQIKIRLRDFKKELTSTQFYKFKQNYSFVTK